MVWNYGSVAIIAMIGGIGFYWTFRDADKEEDALNLLKESTFIGIEGADPESTAEIHHVRDEKNEKGAFN